jgi:hypothetical protein
MKYAIIATVLIIGATITAHAEPCVTISPTRADCTEAMAKLKAAEPEQAPGIPIQSATLTAQLLQTIAIHQALVQMTAAQTETNRLLTAIVQALPSTHAP